MLPSTPAPTTETKPQEAAAAAAGAATAAAAAAAATAAAAAALGRIKGAARATAAGDKHPQQQQQDYHSTSSSSSSRRRRLDLMGPLIAIKYITFLGREPQQRGIRIVREGPSSPCYPCSNKRQHAETQRPLYKSSASPAVAADVAVAVVAAAAAF